MTSKIPPSAARVESQRAGSIALSQQLVTQRDLDAVFGSPVMTAAERAHAKVVVGTLRGAVESGRLSAWAHENASIFADALERESAASDRIGAARDALAAGVIDERLFSKLSDGSVGLSGRVDLWKQWASAKLEIDRLTPIVEGAAVGDKPALQEKLDAATAKHAQLDAIVKTIGAKSVASAVNERANIASVVAVVAVVLAAIVGIVAGIKNMDELGFQASYLLTMGSLFGGFIGAATLGPLTHKLSRIFDAPSSASSSASSSTSSAQA